MERHFSHPLTDWLTYPSRMPLILQGARQVGKTWLVRDLAVRAGRELVEINFERNPELEKCFRENDPQVILGQLSLVLNRTIDPEKSLLFLDEIQAAGGLLAKLRWFAEELPELPVVAAGSLLEFTLADHSFSMPVGRVAFRNVEPMGFPEFLLAHGNERLLKAISEWRPGSELSRVAHEQALKWHQRYAMVGGLPSVVAADVAGEPPFRCRELQQDLIAAFRTDFPKYSGRMQPAILDSVLRSVAVSIGRKFIYAQAGEGLNNLQSKRALELLVSARICHFVRWSAGNALPLGSEMKDKFRKAVLLDVGLLHALAGTPAAGVFPSLETLAPDMRARIAEQVSAQHLRLLDGSGTGDPDLFYWQREGGSPAEIDYLFATQGKVIPIELKSGAIGRMRSLHQFMFDKGFKLAVRSDINPPGVQEVDIKTTTGQPVRYRLLNVPIYLLWNLPGIVESE